MITDKLQMIEIRGIMSDKITLLYNVQNEVTVLPNKFIDEYMIKADGEYVKIYLLILRLQGMGLPVDCLLYTSTSPRDPKTSSMPSSA